MDDDPSVRRALTRAMERAGYEVIAAADCATALSFSATYEAAVLDLELPDGDGAELGERLLAQDKVTALLFFSGARSSAILNRARTLGLVLGKEEGAAAVVRALQGLHAPSSQVRDKAGAAPAARTRLGSVP